MTTSRTSICPAIPIATYRLQLNSKFGLKEAQKIIPHLKRLGISHIYCSPLLKARRGSSHCYDVISHSELNPELGSSEEFQRFCDMLTKKGMALVVDIVPNHMSTDTENSLWFDVLEKGTHSKLANYFDIDWDAQKGRRRVILPILGSELSVALKAGDLKFATDLGIRSICLELYGKRLPISSESYNFMFSQELGYSATKLKRALLTEKTQRSLKKRLEIINSKLRRQPDWAKFREFLGLQHYSLEYWRDSLNRINYRRFFYINDLVAIRSEERKVFLESHSLIRDWIKSGRFQALRVDHIDGLKDPAQYLEWLRKSFSTPRRSEPYVLVEKILSRGEDLPKNWKISGTTGYEFMRRMNGLFVERENERAFRKIYGEFTGLKRDFETVALDSKRTIVKRFMGPDLDRLISVAFRYNLPKRFERVSKSHLRRALVETSVHFSRYRTYASESGISEIDRSIIEKSLEQAKKYTRSLDKKGIDLLRHLLLSLEEKKSLRYKEFCLRYQQFTPTIAAKGLEDTAFFRYFPLSSLNEVGGEPSQFGVSLEEFHSENVNVTKCFPNGMLSSSTHDTKWSEDARARLNVLSELPREWSAALDRWSSMNRRFKTRVEGKLFPTRNDEYMLYQAILAVLPLENIATPNYEFVNRIVAYMGKVTKEEKRETDWIDPNAKYDVALEKFVRNVLDRKNEKFLFDMATLLRKVSVCGMYNSLSQLLLKLTCPGVPDIYQGCESWNFRLVDPDNRTPVNFDYLLSQLREMKGPDLEGDLFQKFDDGSIKMYLLKTVLQFRKENQELFNSGGYLPLVSVGTLARNVISFAREFQRSKIIVVAPRFFSEIKNGGRRPIGEVWNDTYLKLPQRFKGEYTNIFTRDKIRTNDSSLLRCSSAFSSLPFCVLSN